MGLTDLLKWELNEDRKKPVEQRKFRKESEIKILSSYEDMHPDKYCTAERDDILRYSCFNSEKIKEDADARRQVESYVNLVLPGFDSRDQYLELFLRICEDLRIKGFDLMADNLLSNKEFDALVVYEKKCHYFTSFDGEGYDISEFIEIHYQEIIGIRDKLNTKHYRPYLLFMKKSRDT